MLDLIDPRTGAAETSHRAPPVPDPMPSVCRGFVFLPGGRDLVVQQNHFDSLDAPASDADSGEPPDRGRRGGPSARRPRGVGRELSATADGRRLFLTVPQDNATYAVDPGRMRVLKRYPVGESPARSVPTGASFALGSAAGGLRLLDWARDGSGASGAATTRPSTS